MRPDLSVPGRMLFVLPRAASSLSSLPVPPTGSSRCCVWPSPLTTPFSGKGVETPLFQALLPTPFQLTIENINHTPKDSFWTEVTLNVCLSS